MTASLLHQRSAGAEHRNQSAPHGSGLVPWGCGAVLHQREISRNEPSAISRQPSGCEDVQVCDALLRDADAERSLAGALHYALRERAVANGMTESTAGHATIPTMT